MPGTHVRQVAIGPPSLPPPLPGAGTHVRQVAIGLVCRAVGQSCRGALDVRQAVVAGLAGAGAGPRGGGTVPRRRHLERIQTGRRTSKPAGRLEQRTGGGGDEGSATQAGEGSRYGAIVSGTTICVFRCYISVTIRSSYHLLEW